MTNSGSNDSYAAFKPLDYKKLAVRFLATYPYKEHIAIVTGQCVDVHIQEYQVSYYFV